MNLEQSPRYQRDENVKSKSLGEFRVINKIIGLLSKEMKVLDIAAAEGFITYLARKAGLHCDGIEIDPNRTKRGFDNLRLKLVTGDIFDNFNMLQRYNVFILSRFLHNIGEHKSKLLLDEIDRKRNYMLIIKYKPGKYRENGKLRQPLATKEGLKKFLERYNLPKKSFPQQTIVVAKGKYVPLLKKLRERIGEG